MACMADQVTDTKSGIQSGLFTDSITGLKFDNRTDPLGCAHWPGPDGPKGSVLSLNFKPVLLSIHRLDCGPNLVSVTIHAILFPCV